MIFITVGSQKFPFDRLIKAMDELTAQRGIKDVFAQTGSSGYIPLHMQNSAYLDKHLFDEKIKNCDILVTHAAAGVMISGMRYRKKIIAIPRLEKYREHVDNHQTELAQALAHKNHLLYIEDTSKLPAALDVIYTHKFDIYKPDPQSTVSIITDFIEKNIK